MKNKRYKQIVVLSGKGGTGKTTVSLALFKLMKKSAIVDCDVDAANLHLLLNPEIIKVEDFSGGKKAEIISEKCTECGLCETLCRFDAISNFFVDPVKCEGCGLCFRACTKNAIKFERALTGKIFSGTVTNESNFYFAKLSPGEGNSGKLVSEIKKSAKETLNAEIDKLIVDGPPGIGCPVNASLAEADFVLIVTEPTVSGIHDLKRLVALIEKFRLRTGILINKHDLNKDVSNEIFAFAGERNIPVIGSLPFNYAFSEALIKWKSIIDVNEAIKSEFISIVRQIEFQLALT